MKCDKLSPLVSVVMNCYNGEKYLREAIDSVISQTYSNWELIVWDNLSVDGSSGIVKSYCDSRIKYYKASEFLNLSPARQRAVQKCSGIYLSFLDCDDIYLPNNLEVKVEVIRCSNAVLAYSGVKYINEEGAERGKYLPSKKKSVDTFESLLRQFDIAISGLIISNKDRIQKNINFSDDIVGSTEYDIVMQMLPQSTCVIIPQYLAKVRIHRKSLTLSLMSHWAADRNITLRRIRKREPGIEKKYKNGFAEAYARADYYHARWLVANGRIQDARSCLHSTLTVDIRYFVLYIFLLLSEKLWDFVHSFLPSSRRL